MVRALLRLGILIFMVKGAYAGTIIKELEQELLKAKNCLPTLTKERVTFCSGVVFNLADLKKASCKESGLNECWRSYFQGLQQAQQNRRKTKIVLAQKYLDQQVEKVKDQSRAAEIQNEIKLVQEYMNAVNWLDEKDIYYFFYRQCETQANCSSEEREKLIAYLYGVKSYLPWTLAENIASAAVKMVRAKEESHLKKMEFKELTNSSALDLMNKNWNELFSYAKSKGITLYKFEIGKAKITTDEMAKISSPVPDELFNTLPEPSKSILVMLLNYSKVGESFESGKYLCDKENNRVMLLTQKTGKIAFIHELLHFEQGMANPKYCLAISEPKNIELDFKLGKISQSSYEEQILAYKVYLWKSEEEVYQKLLGLKGQTDFELSNNQIQYLKYLSKGTASVGEADTKVNFKGNEISFMVKDDLPFVKVENSLLVLDLGAMNSVTPPTLIFSPVKPLGTLNLTNVKNEVVEVPYVEVQRDIQLGEVVVSGYKTIIAHALFKGIDGVVGLDLFENKNLELYPKDLKLKMVTKLKKPKTALSLQKNYQGKIKALEFICPKGEIIRLDTGSQVLMDVASSLQTKKRLICGNLNLSFPPADKIEEAVIFSHGVTINLGWPWLSQWKKVTLALSEGWINFE